MVLSVYNFNQSYQKHLGRYYDRVTEFIILISDIYSKDKEIKKRYDSRRYVIEIDGKKIGMPNVYVKEFQAGYETWLLNRFVSDGVKSFKKIVKKQV